MQMTLTREAAEVDQAARIWAETTAARDGEATVPSLDLARPVIQSVLDASPQSFLLMAHLPETPDAVGFAAVEPVEAAEAELRYLGVRPSAWGSGVARSLLTDLPTRASELGFKRLRLSVYVDNVRAVELYQRLAWVADGAAVPHPRNGRLEQRYVLSVG
ncbi:GNAT family N-acetyltransferase [Kribbella sandramycini]|uniref:GNAT family N-acetyltransferase n=1 Tax=Kribbella sandramycini TaxID=60450 RepID=A0A7Y4KU87_9ACTN|nr:GNAT family N-acetyltransferase [Kribbella sandramycini]MBB6568662.1 ribosomal protein S18 acetylase RimI-like enzyme [Kribbella sandramycini]NOL38752.1 GNAT family N-acetyltransferase [Kribbella sandramycini]